MNYYDIITDDTARRIYYDLQEHNRGQLPFEDFKLEYTLQKKNKKNNPLEVDLHILDESGQEKTSYYLKYGDTFSDYRVIEGNIIVKR